MAEATANFPNGIFHPAKASDNFPNGIFHPAEAGDNFVSGIFHPAEAGDNFVSGIFHPAEAGDNFVSGIFHPAEAGDNFVSGKSSSEFSWAPLRTASTFTRTERGVKQTWWGETARRFVNAERFLFYAMEGYS